MASTTHFSAGASTGAVIRQESPCRSSVAVLPLACTVSWVKTTVAAGALSCSPALDVSVAERFSFGA